jgi:hypothetical protein
MQSLGYVGSATPRAKGDARQDFCLRLETAEKAASASACSGRPRLAGGGVPTSERLVLCGFRPQRSSDRMEVDEDGGPERLERRFSSPEVAALAGSVAVDDQSEQALDP